MGTYMQAIFSVFIFVLLASEDGFQTKWKRDEAGILRAPAVYNGASTFFPYALQASVLVSRQVKC